MNATKRFFRFRWWCFSLRSLMLLMLALSGLMAYAGAGWRTYQMEQRLLAELHIANVYRQVNTSSLPVFAFL